MKQIYHFDSTTPPMLSEQMLTDIAFKKRLRRQTALLTLGGALLQGALLYIALILRFHYPLYSILLIFYSLFSFVGFAVISIIITAKRRKLKCILPL